MARVAQASRCSNVLIQVYTVVWSFQDAQSMDYERSFGVHTKLPRRYIIYHQAAIRMMLPDMFNFMLYQFGDGALQHFESNDS